MNYRKVDPVYIDVPIDKFQAHIFDSLPDFSPIWESYHRAYLNPKEKFQYIPEVYFNRHYSEVLITNRTALTSFFTASNEIEVNPRTNQHSGTISLFVQCSDLDALSLHTGVERPDAEFRNEFILAYNKYKGGDMDLIRIVTGIEEVYQGMDTTNVTFQDMNEWFVFRMDFRATFYATQKCN